MPANYIRVSLVTPLDTDDGVLNSRHAMTATDECARRMSSAAVIDFDSAAIRWSPVPRRSKRQ